MFHFCFEEAKIILFLVKVRTQEIKKKERVFAIINII